MLLPDLWVLPSCAASPEARKEQWKQQELSALAPLPGSCAGASALTQTGAASHSVAPALCPPQPGETAVLSMQWMQLLVFSERVSPGLCGLPYFLCIPRYSYLGAQYSGVNPSVLKQ